MTTSSSDRRSDDPETGVARVVRTETPFGAGIEGTRPARTAQPARRAPVASERATRGNAPAPSEIIEGPANRVDGRLVAAATGHTFRDPESTRWPRSGPVDADAAVEALGGLPGTPESIRGADAADAVARACTEDESLRTYLDAQLGPAASTARYRPTAQAILDELAVLARGPHEDDVPDGEIVALRPHWSESIARIAARVLRAVSNGAAILIATDPLCPHLGLALARGLDAAGLDPRRVAVLHDDGQDVLRALAGRPEVCLDAVCPDAFVSGLVHRLTSLRESAERARQDEASDRADEADAETHWFGRGVVDRPAAPLRLRASRGRDVAVGDVHVPGDVDVLRITTEDLDEAAEQVVELAYGRSALGGHADDAAARVFVERHAFSRFTASVLEVLEDADGDPWFDPPPWALSGGGGRMTNSLSSARRIGLDEGATLVHERALRRKGASAPHGLVFTNVEPRMRLGGALRVPGVLSLIRGVGSKER